MTKEILKMYVTALAVAMLSVFFDVQLPSYLYIFFGVFGLISIFIEGKVSLVTNFSYERYVKLTKVYERSALRDVMKIRTTSAVIAVFATLFYGLGYFSFLNIDYIVLGAFVLNVSSYLKYLNAEYILRSEYAR